MIHPKWHKVSEAEFDKALHSKESIYKNTCHIIEPPVTFFWSQELPDMSFGKGAFGAIQHGYDVISRVQKDNFYLHKYNK